MRSLAALALALVFAGCFSEPPAEPVSRVDLRSAIGYGTDIYPSGVAIAPDGQRYVLDTSGFYRIEGDGAFVVVTTTDLPPPDVQIQFPITDIVALAPDLFAFTAIGDGYLFDTSAMTIRQHFCYVPESTPEGLTQRTDAIAYDATADRIYAQPRTFDIGTNLLSTQFAGYTRETGALTDWHEIAVDTEAGGMVSIPDIGLVLGQGSRLDLYEVSSFGLTVSRFADLSAYGITHIDGLAHDPVAGTLLVLDGWGMELVEIELARLID